VIRHVSQALPGYAYGDPAKIVEAQELRTLGCAACVRSDSVFGVRICTSGLKLPACKQGHRNGYKLASEYGG